MFNEKIGTLTKVSSTQVQLTGSSVLKLGGQQRVLTNPTLLTSVSGLGGIDTGVVAASSRYYVYAVFNGAIAGLVASLSAISPTGFTRYKKVGAFFMSAVTTISSAFNLDDVVELNFKVAEASTTSVPHGTFTAMPFVNAPQFDNLGIWNSSISRFTVPVNGSYDFKMGIGWAISGVNTRAVGLVINGTFGFEVRLMQPSASDIGTFVSSAQRNFLVSEQVGLIGYQSTGGALNATLKDLSVTGVISMDWKDY